jgi:hypothetical protein
MSANRRYSNNDDDDLTAAAAAAAAESTADSKQDDFVSPDYSAECKTSSNSRSGAYLNNSAFHRNFGNSSEQSLDTPPRCRPGLGGKYK